MNYLNDIKDLPPHMLSELRNFFEEYKKLEKKTVKVKDFQDKATAIHIIEKAATDYKKALKSGKF